MPTLLIDEGDFKMGDETDELIKFINLGFEKNQRMFNCDKNDPSKLEFFDPFCPKIITRRKQFKDQATEARCFTETMQQTNRKEIPALLTNSFYKAQEGLRNKLLKFRFDYYHKIDIDECINIDLGDIEPRIKQTALAFTPLLANVEGAFEKFKDFLKRYNKNIIEERSQSYDGQIINGIIELIAIRKNDEYNEKGMNITCNDIVEHLKLGNFDTTTRTVGKHLSALNLKTQPKKVAGKTEKLVPLNNRLLEVIKRYNTDEEKVTMVSFVTSHTSTPTILQSEPNIINNKILEEDVCVVTNGSKVTINISKEIILTILDQLIEKTQQKLIPLDMLLNAISASYSDLKVEIIETTIEELKHSGELYEPKHGFLARL